ncbi:hypothetical protein JZ751_027103 [Albula glossodonta]|uniref:trypsin n=1 Tax=Albula glossodonta TaxID=121402 RepID=A0A8T2NGT8_9TELE|nr:hypothetical protein JZ751_027103 [Albula glossodonta]
MQGSWLVTLALAVFCLCYCHHGSTAMHLSQGVLTSVEESSLQTNGFCLPPTASPLCRSSQGLKNLDVAVGEFDRTVTDAGEQTFTVQSIKVHEKYHHSIPMSYDIALLKLSGRIRFGGPLPAMLHEVQLELLEQAKCKYIIQTVKSGQETFTVICAGPERGGKDACQGGWALGPGRSDIMGERLWPKLDQ